MLRRARPRRIVPNPESKHTTVGAYVEMIPGVWREWCRKRDSNPRPHHYE